MNSDIKIIKTKNDRKNDIAGNDNDDVKSGVSKSKKDQTPKKKKPSKNSGVIKEKVEKTNIVFVCTGNTCRSPVAEFVCKYLLRKMRKISKYNVTSAGTSAYDGEQMSSLSKKVLSNNNIPYDKFLSKQLTREMEKASDFIICMTEGHKIRLQGLEKVYSIGDITGYGDVKDPYGGTITEYEEMYEYISYAVKDVLKFVDDKLKKS